MVNILKEYPSARPLLEHKNKNKNLTTDHRNSLIKIIVEEAVSNQIPIRIQDFPILLNEIVSVFPSEKDVQVNKYIVVTGRILIILTIITKEAISHELVLSSDTENSNNF